MAAGDLVSFLMLTVFCGTWRRCGRGVQEPRLPKGMLRSLILQSTSQGAHFGHNLLGLPELLALSPFCPGGGHPRWGSCVSSGDPDSIVFMLGSDCHTQSQHLRSSSVLPSEADWRGYRSRAKSVNLRPKFLHPWALLVLSKALKQSNPASPLGQRGHFCAVGHGGPSTSTGKSAGMSATLSRVDSMKEYLNVTPQIRACRRLEPG